MNIRIPVVVILFFGLVVAIGQAPYIPPAYTQLAFGEGVLLGSEDNGTSWVSIDVSSYSGFPHVSPYEGYHQQAVWVAYGTVVADGTEYVYNETTEGADFNRKIYRTVDFGDTWTLVHEQMLYGTDDSYDQKYVFCYLGDGEILAVIGSNGEVYRSTNWGETWGSTPYTTIGTVPDALVYSLVYENDSKIVGSGFSYNDYSAKIFSSTNGGASFSTETINGDGFDPQDMITTGGNGKTLLSISNDTILKSDDYGATWTVIPLYGDSPPPAIRAFSYLGSGTTIASIYGNSTLLESTNYGTDWTTLASGQFETTTVMHLTNVDGETVLASGGTWGETGLSQGKIFKSTNSGQDWSMVFDGGSGAENVTSLVLSIVGSSADPQFESPATPVPIPSFTSNVTSGDDPLAVQFTDQSVTDPTGWNWSYQGNSGGNTTLTWWSTDQNPVGVFTEGTWNIHLNVTNASGYATTSENYYITVSPVAPIFPEAAFSADVASGTAPLIVQFTDESVTDPTGWNWSFGDGEFSELQNPEHTYSSPGLWDVSLNVTNASGYNITPGHYYIDVSEVPYWAVAGTSGYGGDYLMSATTYNDGTGNATFTGAGYSDGILRKYNTTVGMTTVAPSLSQGTIWSLTTYNDGTGNAVFGGTGSNSHLYKYNRTIGHWLDVADQADWMTGIYSLTTYNDGSGDAIFGGAAYPWESGNLYKYNATTDGWAWVGWQNDSSPGDSIGGIISLAVYNDGSGDAIYAGTIGGSLHKFNATIGNEEDGHLEMVIPGPALGTEFYIWSLATFDDGTGTALYAGTSGSGKLLKFNATTSSWAEVAGQMGSETTIYSLAVYNDGNGNALYGSTAPNAMLLKYDPVYHRWEAVQQQNLGLSMARSLTVTDDVLYCAAGSSGTLLRYNVTLAPVASFTRTPAKGKVPLTVSFTDTTTHLPTSWNWSFGDGNYSSLQNPSHVYEAIANHTVTLNATNSEGTSTYVGYVEAVQAIGADFDASVYSGVIPLSVDFTDTSTGAPTNPPTSWSWNFGDGNTSILQNPSHTFEYSGEFAVRLNTSGAWGFNITSKNITVGTNVVSSFTSNVTTGVPSFGVAFTDTSSGFPTEWNWSFGDGTYSDLQNPEHTYTNTGNFTVNLTAQNLAGGTPYIGYIEGFDAVVAGFTKSASSGAVPLSIDFTDTSTGVPSHWQWSFGDGNFSNETSPSHIYASAGNYTATLTAWNNGPAPQNSTSQEIAAYDTILAGFSQSTFVGLVPLSASFIDTTTGNPTTWNWSFGDGNFSDEQNPSHVFEFAGLFDVNLTASNPISSDYYVGQVNVTSVVGFLNGYVMNAQNVTPISGAVVNVTQGDTNISYTTAADGFYNIYAVNFIDGVEYDFISGNVSLNVSATGFVSYNQTLSFPAITELKKNVTLMPTTPACPSGVCIGGVARNTSDSEPIPAATVNVWNATVIQNVNTNSLGFYIVTDCESYGTYYVMSQKTGFFDSPVYTVIAEPTLVFPDGVYPTTCRLWYMTPGGTLVMPCGDTVDQCSAGDPLHLFVIYCMGANSNVAVNGVEHTLERPSGYPLRSDGIFINITGNPASASSNFFLKIPHTDVPTNFDMWLGIEQTPYTPDGGSISAWFNYNGVVGSYPVYGAFTTSGAINPNVKWTHITTYPFVEGVYIDFRRSSSLGGSTPFGYYVYGLSYGYDYPFGYNNQDTEMSPQPNVTQDSIRRWAPTHDVRFIVKSFTGTPITDAVVTVNYVETSGPLDWLFNWIGVPATTNTSIQNATLTGHTGSDGAIDFLMVQSVQYNVTAFKPNVINSSMLIYPKDDEYTIWVNTVNMSPLFEKGYNELEVISASAEGHELNTTAGRITINYNDTLGQTTSALVLVNRSVSIGNVTSETTVASYSQGAGNFTHDFDLLDTRDHSYRVHLRTSGTVFANVSRDYGVTFPPGPVSFGIPENLLVYAGMFGLMVITFFFGRKMPGFAVFITMFFAWIFYYLGWWRDLAQPDIVMYALIFFTVIAIIYNIVIRSKKEYQG